MSKFILRVLGSLFLIIIILKFDRQNFYLVFREVKLLPIIIACFLNIVRLFVETLRWNSLLEMQKIYYKLKDAFLVVLSSIYAGIVTPGRIGNFIRVFYIKDDINIPFSIALSGVIMDKLIELITLICLGWWGLTLLGIGVQAIIVIGLSLFLVLFIFVIINYKRLHVMLEKFFLKAFKLAKHIKRFDEEREMFYKFFRQFKNIKLLKPVAFSFLAFIILFTQALFVAGALDIPLSFMDLSRTMSLTRLIARVIPISFLGLGSKDVTFTAILNKNFNIAIARGIAFSIIFLFTSYLISAIAGAISWFIKPIRI